MALERTQSNVLEMFFVYFFDIIYNVSTLKFFVNIWKFNFVIEKEKFSSYPTTKNLFDYLVD